MSEAILYAIDAPQVKDANAAADFVAQWDGRNEAPTSGIATLFVRLMFTWPRDGSKGVVWHEEAHHDRPNGPTLALTFELATFDDERLQHLRAMAKHHRVHIFDPEGHVLYLSDGTEAGVPAMAAPAPGEPVQCSSGVRFDGVYESKMEKSWSYLCFTAEGKILWQSIAGRFPARAVMDTFIAGDSFVVKGTYKPGDSAFTARLKASFGAYKMEGVLKDDGLHVHSERTNGRYPYDAVYTFVPLQAAAT